MINWVSKIIVAIADDDTSSHIGHFMLIGLLAVLGLVISGSLLAAAIAATVGAVLYAIKEGYDIAKHKADGHDMSRWYVDGFFDLLAPVAHAVAWWCFYFVQDVWGMFAIGITLAAIAIDGHRRKSRKNDG